MPLEALLHNILFADVAVLLGGILLLFFGSLSFYPLISIFELCWSQMFSMLLAHMLEPISVIPVMASFVILIANLASESYLSWAFSSLGLLLLDLLELLEALGEVGEQVVDEPHGDTVLIEVPLVFDLARKHPRGLDAAQRSVLPVAGVGDQISHGTDRNSPRT